jgi:hypothetical protein
MKFPVYPESAARDSVHSLPRLSMDEYLAFVEANIAQCDPEKARLQKELEEDIKVMFSFHPSRIRAIPSSFLNETSINSPE